MSIAARERTTYYARKYAALYRISECEAHLEAAKSKVHECEEKLQKLQEEVVISEEHLERIEGGMEELQRMETRGSGSHIADSDSILDDSTHCR